MLLDQIFILVEVSTLYIRQLRRRPFFLPVTLNNSVKIKIYNIMRRAAVGGGIIRRRALTTIMQFIASAIAHRADKNYLCQCVPAVGKIGRS